jgi:hypothetical protein
VVLVSNLDAGSWCYGRLLGKFLFSQAYLMAITPPLPQEIRKEDLKFRDCSMLQNYYFLDIIHSHIFSLLFLFWKSKSKLMRSLYCLCVCVCVSPKFFSFSLRFVSYQRKVDDYFFTEFPVSLKWRFGDWTLRRHVKSYPLEVSW